MLRPKMEFSSFVKPWITVVGVVLGVALWFGANSEERDVASRAAAAYLERFGTKDETPAEIATLEELFTQSRETRTSFLRGALTNAEAARRLIAHQQGFTVALSRIDQNEVNALFETAIEPALRASAEPDVLRAGVLLANRWSIAKALQATDRTELLAAIVARLIAEPNHQMRSALLPVVTEFATNPPVSLATQVLERMEKEHVPATLSVLASALASLESSAGAAEADQLATRLVHRIASEPNVPALRALTPALEPLKGNVSSRAADELAGAVVNRAAAEINPSALDALRTALEAFTSKLGGKQANDLAPSLLKRMTLEQDPVMLATLAWTFNALGEGVEAGHVERGADRILTRMAAERDPVSLAVLTSGLGAFARAGESKFEAAAARVVEAMLQEQDAYKMSILASALKIIPKGRLDESKARALAYRLSARRVKEWNIPALLPLDVAISVLKEDDPPAKPPETIVQLKPPGACTPEESRVAVARQILSPGCKEQAWIELVRAMGKMVGQPLVKDAAQETEDQAPDFDQLTSLSDDDDGADAKKIVRPDVDFAALSTALDPFRPSLESTRYDWGRRTAALMIMVALAALIVGLKRRRPEPRRSA